jgi:hypothetical protein
MSGLKGFEDTLHTPLGPEGVVVSIKNNGNRMSDIVLGHVRVSNGKTNLKFER